MNWKVANKVAVAFTDKVWTLLEGPFHGVMCRCKSVWDDSACPFLMTKIKSTVTHCHSALTSRSRKMERRDGVNIQRGGVRFWQSMLIYHQSNKCVHMGACVCLSLIVKMQRWLPLPLQKKNKIWASPKRKNGLQALFPSLVFVSVTEIPIIHRRRTFLFSAIGMWSNSFLVAVVTCTSGRQRSISQPSSPFQLISRHPQREGGWGVLSTVTRV